MDFCFAIFVALFSVLSPASCAPAGLSLQDACADVRSSSLELNHIAKTVSVEARNGSKDVTDFSTSLAWMEAKDMCDPGTLRKKPAPCIRKILQVLSSYKSAVERVGGFQSCSEFVSKVKPVMQKLHKDMNTCVNSREGMTNEKEHRSSEGEVDPIEHWQEALLCHYTLDRLFSFSILTARVFAVGDPVHHAQGSVQKCM